jgi:hypothetical protein
MQVFYEAKVTTSLTRLTLLNGVELFGWEFIWRGLVLFALARAFGPGPAILLQSVPFAFMHLGKPEIETFSTLFGGAAFGLIAGAPAPSSTRGSSTGSSSPSPYW